MKELIKKTFYLWVRLRWAQCIDKTIEQREKAYAKYKMLRFVETEQIKEYCKKYPDAQVERWKEDVKK